MGVESLDVIRKKIIWMVIKIDDREERKGKGFLRVFLFWLRGDLFIVFYGKGYKMCFLGWKMVRGGFRYSSRLGVEDSFLNLLVKLVW